MGTCYKLILGDEFDWGYSETSKEEQLKEFERKYGGYIERIAEWYGFVVYDVDKQTPYLEERKNIIREYADTAYYIADYNFEIVELDLPIHKPSVQKEMDRLETRRTPADKQIAEDYIRQKLLMKADFEEKDT